MRKSDLYKTNPLFFALDGANNFVPAYSAIEPEHFIPALDYALDEARRKINAIKKNPRPPSFKNTIEALEQSTALFNYFSGIFQHMVSVRRSTEMERLEKILQAKDAAFRDEMYFDIPLFKRIHKLFNNQDNLRLDQEDSALLNQVYQEFFLNGAAVTRPKQKRIYEINQQLSKISSDYDTMLMQLGENTRMEITDPAELDGISPDMIERARTLGAQSTPEKKWVFKADNSTWFSVMVNARNRDVRKRFFSLNAASGNALDLMKEILNLRYERARLLGFQSHAERQFKNRMIGSRKEITAFLDQLRANLNPAVHKENAEIRKLAKEDGLNRMEAWDQYYYEERLREKTLGISANSLRPFFSLHNVMGGSFALAEELYGLKFVHDPAIEKWHDDVESFSVWNTKTNEKIAVLQVDIFGRTDKSDNAWCTTTTSRGRFSGRDALPVVIVAASFAKSADHNPTLLSLDEVRVIFHEMGHALHAIFSKSRHCRLSSLSNVKWDFVELASQIFENWALEPETLDRFARHYQTGDPLPEDLKLKIRDSRKFMGGNTMKFSLKMTYLDLLLHSRSLKKVNLSEYEPQALKKIFPGHSKRWSLTSTFQHIATMGYDAGYYAYIWSEALDADAFDLFKEKGLDHQETALKFKELMEAGAVIHPADLFRAFRGRDVDPAPLLRRYGLIQEKHATPCNDNVPTTPVLLASYTRKPGDPAP